MARLVCNHVVRIDQIYILLHHALHFPLNLYQYNTTPSLPYHLRSAKYTPQSPCTTWFVFASTTDCLSILAFIGTFVVGRTSGKCSWRLRGLRGGVLEVQAHMTAARAQMLTARARNEDMHGMIEHGLEGTPEGVGGCQQGARADRKGASAARWVARATRTPGCAAHCAGVSRRPIEHPRRCVGARRAGAWG
jgi:hypothetical protein